MPDSNDLMEVALFPIPNAVAFPGTVLPLHVFEPRYRRLVQECLEANRLLGVSHTAHTIHEPRPTQTVEEALSSNQATFAPREVFTAGRCELLQTLDDGRMLVQVHMAQRVVLLKEQQSLSYRIVSCRTLEDEPLGDEAAARQQQESVHAILTQILRSQSPDDSEAIEVIEDPAWITMSPGEYSFRIFQLLRFDPDLMQEILEMTRPEARLGRLHQLFARD